jgi:hypothetical protein
MLNTQNQFCIWQLESLMGIVGNHVYMADSNITTVVDVESFIFLVGH